jgi:predicted kinase
MIENITLEEVEEVISEPVQLVEKNNQNLFFGDNWYKKNSDKILGTPYEASGRFGKVTKYRGGIDVLDLIDADENFTGANKVINDPLASVSNDMNISAEMQKIDVQNIVKNAIDKSYNEISSTKKKSKKIVDEDAVFTPVDELNSFDQTFRNLNQSESNYITLEEVEVYTWYKTQIGKPLSALYVKLFKPEMFEGESDEQLRRTYEYNDVTEEKLTEWVESGYLFYHKGNLLPQFEFLSGNMYDKKMKVESEKDEIVSKYGQTVYDNHLLAIKFAFDIVYRKRLMIGGENSLVILANSKLAKNFMISRIEDLPEDKKFKIAKVTAQSDKDYGRPDFIKDLKAYSSQRFTFEELNLADAFSYWLLKQRPQLKEPISYLDIHRYYVEGSPIRIQHNVKDPIEVKKANTQREKIKSSTQREGERLFRQFLETQLTASDKLKLETIWNIDYNNYLPVDLNKIPVAFTMAKRVFGKPEIVKAEKRDAVAFTMSNGTGILSYDVGVGKTPSAIFTISAFIDAGYCKRPIIVVPNQVYRQFISEIKMFTPHIPINEGYNFSKEYIENFRNNKGEITKVAEGTITIITYEGLESIGFSDDTSNLLVVKLYEILNQGGEDEKPKSEKQKASFRERIETIVGKGLKGGMYNIEDFGFDFMCYDEAHKMKKVFTSVKGETEKNDETGKVTKGKNPYAISSGSPSSIALKGFMLNYYILQKNDYKNILLLTATPFTNSPLEIFSMLSMVAYETLRDTNLDNLKSFFDNYIQTSTELVINSKLKPQFKQVILGFNNLISLQSLIRRFILYKTGEEVKVPRPKKYVLPYLKEIENGISVNVPDDRKVETYIGMTPSQNAMMNDIIQYIEDGSPLGVSDSDDEENEGIISDEINIGDYVLLISDELTDKGNNKKIKAIVEDIIEGDENLYTLRKVNKEKEIIEGKKGDLGNFPISKIIVEENTQGVDVDEDVLSENEKLGVRTIKGLSYSRNLALSPYLYEFSGLGKPNYKTYVENSPKLLYVMNCIKSVKDYCTSNNEQIAGQIIYMDRGVAFFGLLKEYLVNVIGFRQDEVGIIKSGLPKTGVRSKDYVKNLFNGEIYNEKTKLFDVVDDYKRIKVVIGSSTIKEGMNLQKYGAVLYNCFIDWNPTDIQQLEGRIYRQGNKYVAVRIVNPLVVDSADIFLFQKLQEKTSRLNDIWSTDGKTNVLNTQEFNPEELKYALIRNPAVIVAQKIIKESANLDSDILGLERQLEIIDRIKNSAYTIKYYYKNILESIKEYRDFVPTNDLLTDVTKLVQVVNALEKSQTDKEGKKIYDYWDRKYLKPEELEKASPLEDTYDKPNGFSDFSVSVRDMNKYINEFIKQYDIKFDLENAEISLKLFKNDVENKIEEFKNKKEFLKSEENKNLLIEEEIAEKERQQINYKTIPQLVTDFGKLNYLIEKKVEDNKKELPKYNSCPPLEADGETRAISKDALDYLNKCLEKEPQTKDLHFDEKTGYTKERVKLHNEIINNLFEGVKCVKSDRQPIAIFTGGSPASGKSTFLEKNAKYLLSKDIFHLDADEIRSKLPEYKGWNANSTQLETTDIVNDILNKIGSEGCRYDFVYDGTMNRAKKYFDLINKAKSLGYKTYIIFMDISYGEAKKRVLERYRDRGRYVPVEVIDDFFTKVGDKSKGEDSLNQLKPMVDGYVVADGITGKIIDEGGEGLPDTREKDVYGEPLLKAETKKVKQPSKSDVKDTIDALQFLADAGNEDAKDTIESLMFLI